MHPSLEPGAQKLLRHKWRKLNTASFHFRCVSEKSFIVCCKEFFHLCFNFYVENVSYCTFTETFAIGFQKWFDHEWIDFGLSLWSIAFFVDFVSTRTEFCINVQVCFSFDEIKSFRWLVGGVFWSVFQKCFYFLARGFCNIDWWALAMHCNFTCYVFASSLPAFRQVMISFRQDCITCDCW